jgi:hypothetical protein
MKEAGVTILRHHPRIYLEEQSKTTKKIQVSGEELGSREHANTKRK